MNSCEQCGKAMATRGGLEIHMEMVHGAPQVPLVVPVVRGPIPATPQGAVPQRAIPAPRAPGVDWQLPGFLHGVDATLPMTALLVVVLFLAGTVAAVHRSSNRGSTAQSASSAAAESAPAVDPAADGKLAQSLVLTPTDYPDGWKFTAHAASPSDATNARQDAACLGLADPATTQSADVSGMDAASELEQASTEVIVFRTPQLAASDLDAEGGPKAAACAKQGLTRSMAADGITVRDIAVGRFALSTGNVRSVALHLEVAVAKGSASTVIHADAVFLQQGRVEGQALFFSTGGEVPVDLEQTLVTRFAHKLANA